MKIIPKGSHIVLRSRFDGKEVHYIMPKAGMPWSQPLDFKPEYITLQLLGGEIVVCHRQWVIQPNRRLWHA